MLRRWDDSQKYLSDNPHLVCEETANCLVVICIDFEIDEVSVWLSQSRALMVGGSVATGLCACAEAGPDGAGGPPGHRHEVHPGPGSDAEGGPQRLLQTVLLKDQGGQQPAPPPPLSCETS